MTPKRDFRPQEGTLAPDARPVRNGREPRPAAINGISAPVTGSTSRGHSKPNSLTSSTDSSQFKGFSAGLRMYRQFRNQIYKIVVVVWLTLSIASVILAAVTWIDF